MAFDGLLLISGSQVGPAAATALGAAADASDDVDCVAAPALSAYCKVGAGTTMMGGGGAIGPAAPPQPMARLAAHLSRSVTAAAAVAAAAAAAPKKYGQRGYQPRFCIRGRNVNAKSSPALRRSMDDAYLALTSPAHGGGGRQFWPPLRSSAAIEDATTIVTAPLSLPAIPLDGSGFSHRLRSRSYYLTAADLTAAELDTLSAAAAAAPSDADSRVFAGLAWAEPDEQGDGGSQAAASTATAPTTLTAAVARKRAKKKAAERISPAAQGAKSDVCDLRIEVKKNKVALAGATGASAVGAPGAVAAALGAASTTTTTTDKTAAAAAAAAALGRKSDGGADLKQSQLQFDSIDSYIGLGRRDWRRPPQLQLQQGGGGGTALYHSAVSISCIRLSRHGGDHDADRGGVDVFMHIKPVRAT